VARIRTFKPELWTNSRTGRLDGATTKVFLGLHNYADDYGVLTYDPDEYAVRILPYEKNRDRMIAKALESLLSIGLAVRFDVARKPFLWLPFFLKHQVVNRPSAPILDGWTATTTPESYGAHVPLTEVSVSTHSGKEGKGKERSGVEVAVRESTRPRNEQWDGLAEVFGYTPTSRNEQSLWGRLSKELAQAGATHTTIIEAAGRYQQAMPSVELTPTALAKHYQRLMAGRSTSNGTPGTAQHTLALARKAAAREAGHRA
jgi:hypothetical protein